MTDDETLGEVADEDGTPPPGFTLEAEASRPDPVMPGIVERTVEPEPDDDLEATDESGDADDDDAIDDPDDTTPLHDI